jgi:hypothetical protein
MFSNENPTTLFTDMNYLRTPEQPTKNVSEALNEIESLFTSIPSSPVTPTTFDALFTQADFFPTSPVSQPPPSPYTAKQHSLSPLVIPSYLNYGQLSAPLSRESSFSDTASLPSPTMRMFSPFGLSPAGGDSPISATEAIELFGFRANGDRDDGSVILSPAEVPRKTSRLRKSTSLKMHADGMIECPVAGCDKTFLKAYNLGSHLKVHSQVKPFSCMHCGFAVKRKHDLRRHFRLVHCQCPTCMVTFDNPDELKAHVKLAGCVKV